ncbi:MAG: hypothetical protein HYS43_01555 [Candidatus Liptonbacteria bacterium]|nr:hypothetical protein [Candidatus Liptonbacteria bacterium]
MAFERFGDIVRGKESPQPERREHVGIGEPLREATDAVREIAHRMAENEENMQRARQEGNLTLVRELQEKQRRLIEERSEILQRASQDRETELADNA